MKQFLSKQLSNGSELKLYSVFGLFPGSGPVVSNKIHTEIGSEISVFFSVEFDYSVSRVDWSNSRYQLMTGSNTISLVMTKLELGCTPTSGPAWSKTYEGDFILSSTDGKRYQNDLIRDKFNMLRSKCTELHKNSPNTANRLIRKKFKSIELIFNEVVEIFRKEMGERLKVFICENEYRVLNRFLELCNARINGYGFYRVKIVPEGILYDNRLITEPHKEDMEVLRAANVAVHVFEESRKNIEKFPQDSKILQKLLEEIKTIKNAYIIMGVHDE